MKYPKIAIRGSRNPEKIKEYFKSLGFYNSNYDYTCEKSYYWVDYNNNINLNSKEYIPNDYTFLETVPQTNKIYELWT